MSDEHKWGPDTTKQMLRRQIAELEAIIKPMLQGGANPDDNEWLRLKMMEAEAPVKRSNWMAAMIFDNLK